MTPVDNSKTLFYHLIKVCNYLRPTQTHRWKEMAFRENGDLTGFIIEWHEDNILLPWLPSKTQEPCEAHLFSLHAYDKKYVFYENIS
jgi:hypothetical protein